MVAEVADVEGYEVLVCGGDGVGWSLCVGGGVGGGEGRGEDGEDMKGHREVEGKGKEREVSKYRTEDGRGGGANGEKETNVQASHGVLSSQVTCMAPRPQNFELQGVSVVYRSPPVSCATF